MRLLRYLPFLDLASYRLSLLRRDVLASATVTFLDIPQGVAYAMIDGLPPAMGLYAAAVPAIAGALFRSSRHVVTGPTNDRQVLPTQAGLQAIACSAECAFCHVPSAHGLHKDACCCLRCRE